MLWLLSACAFAQNSAGAQTLDSLAGLVSYGLFLAITLLYSPGKRGAQEQIALEETGHPPQEPGAGRRNREPEPSQVSLPELVEQINALLRECRRLGSELTVLHLAVDAPLSEDDPTTQAEIRQTLLSISQLRAARLYQLAPKEYLVACCGELPGQARLIAEDYRQSVVDLGLGAGTRPLTISIGMFSGPAEAMKGAREFIDCARARLDSARRLGGNRVEASQS